MTWFQTRVSIGHNLHPEEILVRLGHTSQPHDNRGQEYKVKRHSFDYRQNHKIAKIDKTKIYHKKVEKVDQIDKIDRNKTECFSVHDREETF